MGLAAPYSVGTSLPSLQRLPSLKPQICNNYSSPVSSHRHVKCALQLQPQTPPPPTTVTVAPDESLVKRRTLIGLFAFDAVLAYSSLNSSSAAETPCEFQVAPSGLAFCDKVVGAGSQAVKGQLIKAHYVGRLENGKVFDSSYNRGKPLTFRVGVGEVIKGWDEGIIGGDGVPPMLAGGKRTLKIPPELGYGSRGAGCRGGSCIIPPDSVLLFDVEFVSQA
ncbi:peptidyl-prolyl cis-trans isomerase FKBP13, chloroplastic [Vigna radiata var. radiata]|uniref:peptidylprolyl isomerase n=1 Tax=Vigna radiata var. radiata TaxID=3916 RepID=A0A1S3UNG5_VIGRR|nr:peptidyl-prolyl cis-trans isomerase FKBP13, chloroplastic [Vigna radiata var. radiata]